MSSIATERDIEDATERLANNPGLIADCFERDSFWKEITVKCYADCEQLRESFAAMHADAIATLAEQIAAERMAEEAEQAADDEREAAIDRQIAG